MMKYSITSQVKEGKLKRNVSMIREAIESFEGKTIVITIEKTKKKRSNPQNAFYHGVVIPIMQQALKDSGHLMSVNDVHELLKLRFLKEIIMINEDTGEVIERVKSTTELTTAQFMEYIADIQRFCSEYFSVAIPDPSSEIKLKFD